MILEIKMLKHRLHKRHWKAFLKLIMPQRNYTSQTLQTQQSQSLNRSPESTETGNESALPQPASFLVPFVCVCPREWGWHLSSTTFSLQAHAQKTNARMAACVKAMATLNTAFVWLVSRADIVNTRRPVRSEQFGRNTLWTPKSNILNLYTATIVVWYSHRQFPEQCGVNIVFFYNLFDFLCSLRFSL
jgi:hypothetical protein